MTTSLQTISGLVQPSVKQNRLHRSCAPPADRLVCPGKRTGAAGMTECNGMHRLHAGSLGVADTVGGLKRYTA